MTKFQQFTRERKYITNVSERTLDWYEESLKWLGIEIPTQTDLTAFVIRMREAGLCPASCNNRIRAVNSYLHWSTGSQGKCGPGCQHLRVSKLKEPQKTLPVFGVEDIRIIARWKPEGFYDKRLQVLVLLLVDTGARISEALGLKWSDVDFDNLLLTLHGKGSKDRKVPFSVELRRLLVKFQHNHSS